MPSGFGLRKLQWGSDTPLTFVGDPFSREHATTNQAGNIPPRLQGLFVDVRVSQDMIEGGWIEREQPWVPLDGGLK